MSEKLNENTCTARELLAKCGDVLDNPLLLAIIEAASSPKAADNYVTSLHWPNDIGRKVRVATRLKERFPDAWETVKAGHLSGRDLFIHESAGSAFPDNATIGTAIILEGQARSYHDWPILLHEFGLTSHGQQITSADCLGETQSNLTVCTQSGINFEIKVDAFDKKLIIRTPNLMFESQIKICQEQVKGFGPAAVLRKFFSIIDCHGGGRLDEIKGNIRLDVGIAPSAHDRYHNPFMGEVIFNRTLPVTSDGIDEAIFTIGYDISERGVENQHYLLGAAELYRNNPIRLCNKRRISENDIEKRFQQKDLFAAFSNLSQLVEFFYHDPANDTTRNTIDLKLLFGSRFFTAKSVIELMQGAIFSR